MNDRYIGIDPKKSISVDPYTSDDKTFMGRQQEVLGV